MLEIHALPPNLASHPVVLSLATAFPRAFSGAALHRLALHALDAAHHDRALALFHRAGLAYRREVVVDALARLRVHEQMARVLASEQLGHIGERARATPARRQALVLETERRLAKLAVIERIEPPFALVDAHEMLAAWWTDGAATASEPENIARAA